MKTLLFTYGTLRPGCSAARRFLGLRANLLGPATIRGYLYDVGGYPALRLDNSGPLIAGDLYRLQRPVALLRALDRYEQCKPFGTRPYEYRREILPVLYDEGTVSAWVYVYNRPLRGCKRIRNNDWLCYPK